MMLAKNLPIAFLCLFVVAGCSPSKPETTKEPKTSEPLASSFADGVTKLAEIQNEVKAAFDSGNPHDCDGALHTAAKILKALPSVAAEEGKLDDDAKETVNSASKQLFEQYMTLHHGFHGESHDGEDAGYESVADAINEAMSKLQSVAGG